MLYASVAADFTTTAWHITQKKNS